MQVEDHLQEERLVRLFMATSHLELQAASIVCHTNLWKNKVFMVGQQAWAVGSGSPGDDSNPNNPSFNIQSSNQCQDPSYSH
jgi:hypothetical protein